jgi:hypothetical protein
LGWRSAPLNQGPLYGTTPERTKVVNEITAGQNICPSVLFVTVPLFRLLLDLAFMSYGTVGSVALLSSLRLPISHQPAIDMVLDQAHSLSPKHASWAIRARIRASLP